jgi:hypothetical protein
MNDEFMLCVREDIIMSGLGCQFNDKFLVKKAFFGNSHNNHWLIFADFDILKVHFFKLFHSPNSDLCHFWLRNVFDFGKNFD